MSRTHPRRKDSAANWSTQCVLDQHVLDTGRTMLQGRTPIHPQRHVAFVQHHEYSTSSQPRHWHTRNKSKQENEEFPLFLWFMYFDFRFSAIRSHHEVWSKYPICLDLAAQQFTVNLVPRHPNLNRAGCFRRYYGLSARSDFTKGISMGTVSHS